MKVFSIMLFKHVNDQSKEPPRLAEALNLSDFGFFKKGSVKELLTFVSRKVVSRSTSSERSSVSHEGYVAHVQVQPSTLSCVVVTDAEYPARVAFDLIRQAIKAFEASSQPFGWKSLTADKLFNLPELAKLLTDYAQPHEVDKVLKVQAQVDEVKDIMTKNIDSMLARHEKLEDLVQKSDDLSFQSKAFAKNSKQLNSRCGCKP
eukprot:TRINITY_DN9682_c0_g1_i1.p1 TRINITY_DN9682_c0_g1~~TRINITY_DN9682_c0_g1_i1.p1  ORF type:complete len:218 (-),score=68.76 TRINITY_DN9682_c0_g1_i1:49-660(-)